MVDIVIATVVFGTVGCVALFGVCVLIAKVLDWIRRKVKL